MKDSLFVIAEAGVNHNGNPDLAFQLVDVALEAGACGTPVILTTECGFDEVKETGCKVVPPLVDELYNGMHSMLSSSQNLRALGNNLRNLILDRYKWQKTAEQYLKLPL